MSRNNIFWQAYLNLESELINISKYIYITDNVREINKETGKDTKRSGGGQLEVYSPQLADFLVRCCIDIEALSKELYFENGGFQQSNDKDLYFDTDCIDLLVKKFNIDKKIVQVTCIYFDLIDNENIRIVPLKGANKRSKAYWVKCYQAVKHDRYNNLHLGNVKACIQALAALYLLNIYYKKETITIKYSECGKLDMSFGSKVFSLVEPSKKYIMCALRGETISGYMKAETSPYILRFVESTYKEIIAGVRENNQIARDFFNNQPELKDQTFVNLIMQLEEKKKKDSTFNYDPLVELFKYRLNKRINQSLPFEERKKLLVESKECNCSFVKNENIDVQITKDNIQEKIDLVGKLYAFDTILKFDRSRTSRAFNYGFCELLLDDGNVKYDDVLN